MQIIKEVLVLLVVFLAVNLKLTLANDALKFGYYKKTCPQAEAVVRKFVQNRYGSDGSITAALLRMSFHDCFITGCDASILIDSTRDHKSEKEAIPNKTVRGFELMDEIKKALEAECPSTVSCTDIIVLATRDAVHLSGGLNYDVPTGRRDGMISNMEDFNLPGPPNTVPRMYAPFRERGFTLDEMVTLLGAHTVGVSHCSLITKPSTMDRGLLANVTKVCASLSSDHDPVMFLDQNTSFVFDNEYYKQLLLKRGIIEIDQQIASDESTIGFVSRFANRPQAFGKRFVKAMIKMGSLGVLVGNQGEIRTNCRMFNSNKPTN